jgi:ATP-binding cassette subfamily B (MDR/TAP) protein 1
MGTATAFGNSLQYVITFIACFVLALSQSPVLALVTLSTIPLVLLVQIATQILARPSYEGERRAFAEASTNVERATAAISTVKVHNAQKAEQERFERLVGKGVANLVKQAAVWATSMSLTDFILLSTFVVGFWYGAKVVRDGTATPGTVMTVFWACLLGATYLQMVVPQLAYITKAKNSMASLRTVIKDPPVPTISNPFSPSTSPVSAKFEADGGASRPLSKIRPSRCRGEFNLRNISFAYPSRPDNSVLRDVTLFIPPGETTFIVGGSGSGKSTVAQLLLRLYTPDGGEITLDDQSFPYLDDRFCREHIAAVQQGCILFDMSIHDNVAMGLAGAGADPKTGIQRQPEDVSREEVVEACKMAMIHDFIEDLPEGYDTRLGTGGSALSGGQRQRLAIARARIRDPTVLILGKLDWHRLRSFRLTSRRSDLCPRCHVPRRRLREHESVAKKQDDDCDHARSLSDRVRRFRLRNEERHCGRARLPIGSYTAYASCRAGYWCFCCYGS